MKTETTNDTAAQSDLSQLTDNEIDEVGGGFTTSTSGWRTALPIWFCFCL